MTDYDQTLASWGLAQGQNQLLITWGLSQDGFTVPVSVGATQAQLQRLRRRKRRVKRVPLTVQAVATSELAIPQTLHVQAVSELLIQRLAIGALTSTLQIELKKKLHVVANLTLQRTVRAIATSNLTINQYKFMLQGKGTLTIPQKLSVTATSPLTKPLKEKVQLHGKVDVSRLLRAIDEDDEESLAQYPIHDSKLKRQYLEYLKVKDLERD